MAMWIRRWKLRGVRKRVCVIYGRGLPSSDGRVELPGDVGSTENKDAGGVVSYTIHLDKHFGFYPPASFAFAFTPSTTQSIDLIDEDDGGLVLARHCEQLFDEPAGYQSAVTYNTTEQS